MENNHFIFGIPPLTPVHGTTGARVKLNIANQADVCPKIKVLFMSGYTADLIAHQGILDKGVNFIQKPFSAIDLAIKLRTILDK